MRHSIRTISMLMVSVLLFGTITAPVYHAADLNDNTDYGFQALVNFRDLGRYQTQDGRQIASKRLLRSAQLYNLPPSDIQLLMDVYNLRHIIDFRSQDEIDKGPDDMVPGAQYHHIEMLDGYGDMAPALAALRRTRIPTNAHDMMMDLYGHLVLSPVAQQGFAEFLNIALNNTEGAIIWHCYAGKDRTGLSAFLLLHILGASEATIYQDYMLTNELRKEANDAILAQFAAQGADEDTLQEMYTLLTVSEDYLDHAIALMRQTYGSIDNYIEQALGITQAQRAQLRDMYLLN